MTSAFIHPILGRDATFDAMKGVAIVCMVAAHAGLQGFIWRFIYLWHMPIFFLVAGWFYRSQANWTEYTMFALTKIRRIWFPFVFWCLVFTLLHNWFMDIGFYPDYTGQDVHPVKLVLYTKWSLRFIIRSFLLSLTMCDGNYIFLTPMWFMQSMMYVLLSYGAVMLIIGKITRSRDSQMIILTLLAVAIILLGRYCTFPYWCKAMNKIGGVKQATLFALFHVGVMLRYFNLNLNRLTPRQIAVLGLAAAMVLALIAKLGVSYNLNENQYPLVCLLVLTSILGFYMIWIFARICGRFMSVLEYIGRHTMPILILHFFFFKLLSWVIAGDAVLTEVQKEAFRLFTVPRLQWTTAYTLVGVVMPLLVNEIWWRIFVKLKTLKSCNLLKPLYGSDVAR